MQVNHMHALESLLAWGTGNGRNSIMAYVARVYKESNHAFPLSTPAYCHQS
jgi:hypothetical protein